jgi:hypothetical protein
MPSTTLVHCQPVRIHETDVPGDVTLVLTAGGNPGDGVVNVSSVPPGVQPPGRATGSTGIHSHAGCTGLYLHYQSATGAGSVVVTWTLNVT